MGHAPILKNRKEQAALLSAAQPAAGDIHIYIIAVIAKLLNEQLIRMIGDENQISKPVSP